MSRIELKNISHSFGSLKVLDDISLSINDGEFFTLLGPSGCGKTTLLRLIAGFIDLTQGDILLDGKSIAKVPSEKRNIGFVFQNYALFPHMTVWENICFGLNIKFKEKSVIEKTAEKYLKLVDMESCKNKKINELSGGQQQRVAVARSLAIEPSILLLDEPMSNLDVSLREEMRSEIKKIQRKLGITTIFVTHDQSEALSVSDKIAVFNFGKCLQCDTPENIYFNPKDDFTANFLGKMNILTKEFLHSCGIEVNKEKLYIRPEQIEILSRKGKNSVEAIIDKKQFTGNITRYFCKVKNETLLADTFSKIDSLKMGSTVFLKLF